MTQQRDNSGVLFKNDRKEKDTHPDYTGRATINGVDMYLSAWIKTGARGKFMSLAFNLPRGEAKEKPAEEKPSGGGGDFDDSIPFGAPWQ